MKKKILLLLAVTWLFVFLGCCCVSAETNCIQVYIDDEKISFDVEPQIINGRTMVPLRGIFEYFGADVEWCQYDLSVNAQCGYLNIQMQIGNCKMYVNNECIILDSVPILQNGRTLVPLRAVAEAFSSNVVWMNETSEVLIYTKYPENESDKNIQFDGHHIRTSNGNYEYFDFKIEENNLTIVGCSSDSRIKKVGLVFDNNKIEKITAMYPGKEFKISLDLDKKNLPEEAIIKLFIQKTGEKDFWSYIKALPIEKTGEEYLFQEPMALTNNKKSIQKWINPVGYIMKDIDSQIVELSFEICQNSDNDYDKALKIHDWVAENIYYNYDYYYGRTSNVAHDALSVYQQRTSVCEGYTNLAQALMHAQNIPCRKISGYALGLNSSSEVWNEETEKTSKPNHIWLQAYADGRWINIDPTWNSGNRCENGELIYRGINNHFYFDISDLFLSYNHKYIKIK